MFYIKLDVKGFANLSERDAQNNISIRTSNFMSS